MRPALSRYLLPHCLAIHLYGKSGWEGLTPCETKYTSPFLLWPLGSSASSGGGAAVIVASPEVDCREVENKYHAAADTKRENE